VRTLVLSFYGVTAGAPSLASAAAEEPLTTVSSVKYVSSIELSKSSVVVERASSPLLT
jgi:hypothetical protein